MKRLNCIEFVLAFASLIVATGRTGAAPVGTVFTYQGRLAEGGSPANGQYDLQFVLFDAASGGNPVPCGFGPTNVLAPVAVSNGQFTLALDFGGGAFDGNARWLEIGVRTNSAVGGDLRALAGCSWSDFQTTLSVSHPGPGLGLNLSSGHS